LQTYLQQLAELQFEVQPDEVKIQIIEDQDWNAQWKQTIQPIDIDGKILIKPSWVEISPNSDLKVIEIDPQMIFGTGVHETTQLMLKLLIKHIDSPQKVLDMGTGTGILAIATALLSHAKITAFDIDPLATTTAAQNFNINHVESRINLFCGRIDAIKNIQFDLILANINRSIIIFKLALIQNLLKNDGLAIFSGILIEERHILKNSLNHYGLILVEEVQQGEWLGLVVRKI